MLKFSKIRYGIICFILACFLVSLPVALALDISPFTNYYLSAKVYGKVSQQEPPELIVKDRSLNSEPGSQCIYLSCIVYGKHTIDQNQVNQTNNITPPINPSTIPTLNAISSIINPEKESGSETVALVKNVSIPNVVATNIATNYPDGAIITLKSTELTFSPANYREGVRWVDSGK